MVVAFRNLSTPVKYCVAAASIVFAILLRFSLDPLLGSSMPYLFHVLAMLLCARYLGFGPSILALAIGVAGPVYYAVVHSRPGHPTTAAYWLRLALIYAGCSMINWLIDRHSRMRSQVESTSRLADHRLEQLGIEVAHRRREEELSAQLRAVVESSDDAIIAKALDGVIRSWNYGAELLFGYTAAEAVGRHISLIVPPDRIFEESEILERIRQGGRVNHFETICRHKSGRQIHVSLSISPISDPDGVITGASRIARDITERKKFEEQLLQTQKLESLGVLAGGLAHDFNNLLTGIMGNASLAVTDVGASTATIGRLQEILAASDRAAVLVRQMLAYSGKGRFVIRLVDLSSQIDEMLPLIRTSVPPSVILDLKLADSLPLIEADAAQIRQLIMNLVTNAAEAITGLGAIDISTCARETAGEVQVVLEVTDTGCGMDEATRARIFDPFFTTKFTGRGLGLAAVHGIIRGQQGSIAVESAPGRGSTFTVVLPAATPARQAAPRPPRLETTGVDGGVGTVLVVDDEELVRSMARVALERCGYRVETAEDGLQAVERFTARPADFDCVLLDLTMPVMDGHEALLRLRQIRPDLPVILSSGYTEVEALRRFSGSGLAGFLQKPYTVAALADKLKQALGPGPAVAPPSEPRL